MYICTVYYKFLIYKDSIFITFAPSNIYQAIYTMKRLLFILICMAGIAVCQEKSNTAEQIIGRLDTVSNIIPVEKVIIGRSLDFLHQHLAHLDCLK